VVFCGVDVDDDVVLQLARAVRPSALSQKLHLAATLHWPVVNLTAAERHTILAILDDAPAALEGLRDKLLESPSWRLRERI
jgi:hypothetical protein